MKHIFAAYFRKILAGGFLIGFCSGCSVFDPAEEIPSYIHIDSMSLSTSGNQGSSSAKITDAWIFMDGNLIGGFELPCTVPILADGAHSFIIRGGVKMNGLTSTRAIYPAWKGWEGTVSLTRGQKVTITPVVTYFSGIDFVNTWMENFDLAGTSFIAEPSSSGIVVKDTIPFSFEGPHSGYVHLNNNDTTFFIGSSSVGYLMPPVIDTWVEFDYWCDAAFTVGIVEEANLGNRTPWVQIEANYEWRKMYVRLTDVLSMALPSPNTNTYKVYFAMQNPGTQSESHLYIDNIKLLK